MADDLVEKKISDAYERMKNITEGYYFTALMDVYSKL